MTALFIISFILIIFILCIIGIRSVTACEHDWKFLGNYTSNGYKSIYDDIYSNSVITRVHECSKCKKIKKVRIN